MPKRKSYIFARRHSPRLRLGLVRKGKLIRSKRKRK